MAKLVSSASMIRILKQALHSNIEVYGLFVYIKIELCGSHRIAVFVARYRLSFHPFACFLFWVTFVMNLVHQLIFEKLPFPFRPEIYKVSENYFSF